MRRRVLGLARRFVRSILKDSILQNLKGDPNQQSSNFSVMPIRLNNLTKSFMKTDFRDVVYGSGQNLIVPPAFLQNPSWSYLNKKSKHKNEEKLKNVCKKTGGVLPNLDILTRNYFNKPPSLNFSDNKGSLKDCLMVKVQDRSQIINKVTVVGAGSVGIATAYTILAQKLSSHICLVDAAKNKLEGEALDIQHGSTFASNLTVEASTGYEITKGSSVCIVTAGARQKEGESRLSLMGRNVAIMKSIIPNLVKQSPNAVIVVASNPVDVMCYVAYKLSGLPKGRVVGSGTNLDSSRFRYYIAQRLGIAPGSCHGWIIGEHGDSSVAVWSGVNVAGVRLMDINPSIGQKNDPENWANVHKQVVESAGEVIRLKGYTSWAIGMSLAALTNAILNNLESVHAVSVPVQGFHDIKEDVYLSLPASLGVNGVNEIIVQHLNKDEKELLHKSAAVLYKTQEDTKV